jgi:hypothetical protein
MSWEDLVKYLGGVSAISLTIAYLGKKAIDSFIAGRIQSYKSNLERIATEHSIQFSSLHSRRAEVIAEIYELLSEVETKARVLSTNIVENDEVPEIQFYNVVSDLLYEYRIIVSWNYRVRS